MIRYKKFLIKTDDHFNEINFSKLEEDMTAIKASISGLPGDFKNEIIISFVKDGSIKKEWIEINPSLSGLVSSKSLAIKCLEDLFDSSSHNEVFRKELETYIREMLN